MYATVAREHCMAIEEGSDYTVEELDDSRIRLTIDGQPLDVYVEKRFSSHHHFGQFSSLDHLVEAVRSRRAQQAEAAEELERLSAESDDQGKGT